MKQHLSKIAVMPNRQGIEAVFHGFMTGFHQGNQINAAMAIYPSLKYNVKLSPCRFKHVLGCL